ncbi:MAG: leucine-rich repeat domain-containing protein, partial [Promethearchaeota archaeon]
MTDEFVIYRGKKYKVKKGTLEIRFKKVPDISEIEGLESLTDLKELILDHNKIREIKGLDHLKNLKELDLRHNEITEIRGLENLTNLKKVYLSGNPLCEEEKYLEKVGKKGAQEVVRYCQERTSLDIEKAPVPGVTEPVLTPVMADSIPPPVEVTPPPPVEVTLPPPV